MSQLSEFYLKHFPLTFLYLISSLSFHVSNAQTPMEPVPTYITHHTWEPSVAITVAAIIFALIFMGIISLYLRRCAESRIIIATTTTTVPCSCSQGINKELLNTFPTLFYSNIKDHKKGKETLECAVCLTDFNDKDTLRLLPKCNHVFHPHCIDSWLASHVTCPVCRANLTQDSSQIAITVSNDQVFGTVTEDNQVESTNPNPNPNPNPNQGCTRSPTCGSPISTSDITKTIYISEEQPSLSELPPRVELDSNPNPKTIISGVPERNLSRSNSTGHSLVETGKNVERYTLRLPEDVRRYILVNHGRSVQRCSSVKDLCWSDSEEKRVQSWVICTPPFVGRHG